MSRESNDGHVCPKCGETIWMEQCACPEPLEGQELLGELFQRMLAYAHETQQRIRASNDSRAIAASNANSRALISALRGQL